MNGRNLISLVGVLAVLGAASLASADTPAIDCVFATKAVPDSTAASKTIQKRMVQLVFETGVGLNDHEETRCNPAPVDAKKENQPVGDPYCFARLLCSGSRTEGKNSATDQVLAMCKADTVTLKDGTSRYQCTADANDCLAKSVLPKEVRLISK